MRRLVTVLCLVAALLAVAACGSVVEPVRPPAGVCATVDTLWTRADGAVLTYTVFRSGDNCK